MTATVPAVVWKQSVCFVKVV